MTPTVTGAPVTTLSDGPRTASQSRDEQKLRAAKAALQAYDQQRSSAAEERKAIARKKAEDLKARIQMLKMSMPADPKAAAAAIAQLARELGAVVKAYGGTADAGLAAVPVVETEGPTSPSPQTAAAPSAEAEPDVAADADAPPTDPYRRAMQAHEARAAEQARKSGDARADSEFAATVKGLLAELKAMARKAAADAKAEKGTPTDLASADQALNAVDTALNEAGGGLSGAILSLVV